MSDELLVARRAALAARAASAKRRRRVDPQELRGGAERGTKQGDEQAVRTAAHDDEAVIRALYECCVAELAPVALEPLGFPPTKLGLRSLVAASRVGSQRAAAALGRVWHASNDAAPSSSTRPTCRPPPPPT